MSISQRITWRSLPIESYNQFYADFNTPVGQYGFTQQAANQNQLVIETNPNFIYLIDRISYAGSIDEGNWLESLGPGSTQPELRFNFLKSTGASLYPYPFPAINYKDNLEFSFWFYSPKKGDQLRISMTGVLNQVPDTVGIATIYAQVSFVIYQENNAEQIRKMKERTCGSIGGFYRNGD